MLAPEAGIAHRDTKVPGLVPDTAMDARSLFALVDKALYLAKNEGRNRVATFGETVLARHRTTEAHQATADTTLQ